MPLHESPNSELKTGHLDFVVSLDRQQLTLVEVISSVLVGAVVEEELLNRRQGKCLIDLFVILGGSIILARLPIFLLDELNQLRNRLALDDFL